jgi:hypothetical protein
MRLAPHQQGDENDPPMTQFDSQFRNSQFSEEQNNNKKIIRISFEVV